MKKFAEGLAGIDDKQSLVRSVINMRYINDTSDLEGIMDEDMVVDTLKLHDAVIGVIKDGVLSARDVVENVEIAHIYYLIESISNELFDIYKTYPDPLVKADFISYLDEPEKMIEFLSEDDFSDPELLGALISRGVLIDDVISYIDIDDYGKGDTYLLNFIAEKGLLFDNIKDISPETAAIYILQGIGEDYYLSNSSKDFLATMLGHFHYDNEHSYSFKEKLFNAYPDIDKRAHDILENKFFSYDLIKNASQYITQEFNREIENGGTGVETLKRRDPGYMDHVVENANTLTQQAVRYVLDKGTDDAKYMLTLTDSVTDEIVKELFLDQDFEYNLLVMEQYKAYDDFFIASTKGSDSQILNNFFYSREESHNIEEVIEAINSKNPCSINAVVDYCGHIVAQHLNDNRLIDALLSVEDTSLIRRLLFLPLNRNIVEKIISHNGYGALGTALMFAPDIDSSVVSQVGERLNNGDIIKIVNGMMSSLHYQHESFDDETIDKMKQNINVLLSIVE